MSRATDGIELTRVGPGTIMGDLMRCYWIPALMSREDRAVAWLEAIGAGRIKPTELSAAQVQSLVHHKTPKVAALAATALQSRFAGPDDPIAIARTAGDFRTNRPALGPHDAVVGISARMASTTGLRPTRSSGDSPRARAGLRAAFFAAAFVLTRSQLQ